jgi:hypothetical protein
MSASSIPQGPGSVSGAPNLPAGFTDTFTSRFIDTGLVISYALAADHPNQVVRLVVGETPLPGVALTEQRAQRLP